MSAARTAATHTHRAAYWGFPGRSQWICAVVNRAHQKNTACAAATARTIARNPAQWEVVVFESSQLNAFALPGGKIGFYTGILDIMENDAQIATVMGHEVAHVYFNHAGERYGRTAAAQAGLSVAQVIVGGGQYSDEIVGALGIGAQYGVILPFSRQHELEADKYGLRYMNVARYDLNEAIRFWEKMSSMKSGQPPEFLSTHPSDDTRIAQLESEIALLSGG